jgi:hypothetical protein
VLQARVAGARAPFAERRRLMSRGLNICQG